MVQYISKDALVAEIESKIEKYTKRGEESDAKCDGYGMYWGGVISCLNEVRTLCDTLEVKEVDLELITGWFDHIAQIADDRMTLTNQRMTDAHALDEIKCLAKNSSEFITKHYKAQKGE
jgi:hypothetical protein